MDKTFKKRVFASVVAAMVMAGSVPLVSINTMADNEIVNATDNISSKKATADLKKMLDDFEGYANNAALYKKDTEDGAYELFTNWKVGTDLSNPNYTYDQSKFGANPCRVTDDVDCNIDTESDGNKRFKFLYNLDINTNSSWNNNADFSGWEKNENYAHCGFLHQQYTNIDDIHFEDYDGIEFEIEGFGSGNTFYIQVGYVTDHSNDNNNARFKYPINLGFTGKKTIKVPFDVLAATDHSNVGMLYSILDQVDRFSFYVNRQGTDYPDGITRTGDVTSSQIYIDNIGLYKAEKNTGKYVDVDDTETITYNGATGALSGETDFDVILARGIESMTITPKDNTARTAPITLAKGTDFTNDVVGFEVKLNRAKLIEKCKDLCSGDYVLTFNFEESTKEGFKDNGWGNETDTVNLKITNNDHRYVPTTTTPAKPGDTVTVVCENCDDEKTVTIPENITGNDLDDYTAPTCTTPGSGTYTDSTTGAEIEVALPATGHDYDTWTATTPKDTDTEITVTGTCANDRDHTITRKLPRLSDDTVWDKTDDENGDDVYTLTDSGLVDEYGDITITMPDGGSNDDNNSDNSNNSGSNDDNNSDNSNNSGSNDDSNSDNSNNSGSNDDSNSDNSNNGGSNDNSNSDNSNNGGSSDNSNSDNSGNSGSNDDSNSDNPNNGGSNDDNNADNSDNGGSNDNNTNRGDNSGSNGNPNTGIATIAVPTVLAAAAVMIVAKRKNKQ